MYKLIVFSISVLVILILSLLGMCTQEGTRGPFKKNRALSGVIGMRKPGQKAGQISVTCEEAGEAGELAWCRKGVDRGRQGRGVDRNVEYPT